MRRLALIIVVPLIVLGALVVLAAVAASMGMSYVLDP